MKSPMTKMKLWPPPLLGELSCLPPLSCLTPQVHHHHHHHHKGASILHLILFISTVLLGFQSICFLLLWGLSFLAPQSSLRVRARTRTSRRRKTLRNTPTTLGSLTPSGSHWEPSCSRAVKSPPGRTASDTGDRCLWRVKRSQRLMLGSSVC